MTHRRRLSKLKKVSLPNLWRAFRPHVQSEYAVLVLKRLSLYNAELADLSISQARQAMVFTVHKEGDEDLYRCILEDATYSILSDKRAISYRTALQYVDSFIKNHPLDVHVRHSEVQESTAALLFMDDVDITWKKTSSGSDDSSVPDLVHRSAKELLAFFEMNSSEDAAATLMHSAEAHDTPRARARKEVRKRSASVGESPLICSRETSDIRESRITSGAPPSPRLHLGRRSLDVISEVNETSSEMSSSDSSVFAVRGDKAND